MCSRTSACRTRKSTWSRRSLYSRLTILKARGLKQVEAADLFGVRQPDVSKMLRGEFRQFSVERLLRFLVALDQDVEIVVRPHRNRNDAAAMQVV